MESPGTSYTYAYDQAGNRTDVWENGVQTQSQSYNAANQVIGWSYDAVGNLLSDGTHTSAYDALSRQVSRDWNDRNDIMCCELGVVVCSFMERYMDIAAITCPPSIEEKLLTKHQVTVREVRQVFRSLHRIRFAEKGYTDGEDVYVAFGQTAGGRYLSVFFIYKPDIATAVIISARTMTEKERRAYGRK